MFAGPIIAREVLTAPRPLRFYAVRAFVAVLLFVLMWTAYQAIVGWQVVSDIGLLAEFGRILFRVAVFVQLTIIVFFAPLWAATNIAHEKDRRTFVLLLMTDLSDLEIVLGKLISSLLRIFTMVGVAAPVLFLSLLIGGVSATQVLQALAVTAAAGLLGGSIGLLVALWRDRTFQALAVTLLVIEFLLGLSELAGALVPATETFPGLSAVLNPYRTLQQIVELESTTGLACVLQVGFCLVGSIAMVALGVNRLRVWNPGRNEPREQREEEPAEEQIYEITEEEARREAEQRMHSATRRPVVTEEVAELPVPSGSGQVPGLTTVMATTNVSAARGGVDGAQPEAAVAVVGAGVPVAANGNGATHTDSGNGVAGGGSSSTGFDGASNGSSEADHGRGSTGLHVPLRTHRRRVKQAKPYRIPWTNPIVWREVMTRAYGGKPMMIRIAYVLVFALAVAIFGFLNPDVEANPWAPAYCLLPLGILSLLLVNAQGVTALTSERDSGALDLLLVTEVTPQQFMYGKLYGILFNTLERIALPIGLAIYFGLIGMLQPLVTIFIVIDFLLLVHFVAMLGLHSAITYTNSRTAVATSLGTAFFLMAGIGICAFLIVQSDREFLRQFSSFLIFIGVGSIALYASLGARNPSNAIAVVAVLTPFLTFYCIISAVNGSVISPFLVSMGIYGFALLAMLVPAVSEFDIALGRTNAMQG